MKNSKKIYRFIQKNTLFLLFSLCLILGVLFFLRAFMLTPDRRLLVFSPHTVTPKEMKNVILLHEEEDSLVETPVTLPAKVDPHYRYHLQFTVDKGTDQQYIAVNTHYAFVTLKHHGKILYTDTQSKSKNKMKVSEAFNLFPIPSQFIGKELTLEIESSLPTTRPLEIPTIPIAPKHELLDYYTHQDCKTNFWGGTLIASGVLLLFAAIFLSNIKHSILNILIIAFFAITTGLYLMTHTWTIYYHFQDTAFIYFIEYTCLMILTLPICLLFLNIFYENHYDNWRVRLFEIIAIIIIGNTLIQYFLVVNGISQFIRMQSLTFLILSLSATTLLLSIITADKDKIPNKQFVVLSLIPMSILLLKTLFDYFNDYQVKNIEGIIISLIFFLVIHFFLAIQRYSKKYNEDIEQKIYSELAYTDLLTKTKNRNAFEEEVEKIKKGTQAFRTFYLFMLDINDLKLINNTYGHKEGDLYLEKTGNILHFIKTHFNNTEAYRYASDEFVVIAYNKTEEDAIRIIRSIENFSKHYKGNHQIPLSIAIGYGSMQSSKKTDFSTIMQAANNNMYKDKVDKKNKGSVDETKII